MDIHSGRVFIARNVKFDKGTLYYQLLKTSNQPKIALEPGKNPRTDDLISNPIPSQVAQRPVAQQPSQVAQKPKTQAINPIDSDDESLSPPPETRESTPAPHTRGDGPASRTRSGGRGPSSSSSAKVSIAMMIEPGPKNYRAALNADDSDQWKEAIDKEMNSMASHGVFTYVEKVPEGASLIESRWVMRRKLQANGQIDKWKVRLVGRGDLQKPAIIMRSPLQWLIRLRSGLPSAWRPSMTLKLQY
jgi:hypothetical protein